MFSSLRLRLTLSYLAVIVLAMGLSAVLILSFVEHYFLQATEDSLVAQARLTAQTLIPGAATAGPAMDAQAPAYNTVQQNRGDIALQTGNVSLPPGDIPLANEDLSYLSDASLQLSTQLQTRIRVLDAWGTVLVDSQQEDQGASLLADPLVARAMTGEHASGTDRGGPGGEALMHLTMPVLREGRLVAVIYLSQPLRDVTAVLYDLRTLWLLPTVIALVLSGVVGLLLSGAIANPLRRLTDAAGAVARGSLEQQVPVRSRDEVGRLSQAFNEMTARLRAARQTQMDFVANVSHELRTPLTSIKGMVETLRGGAADDPEVRDRFLETAESETDRLIRLVQDLLLLSRADSEALDLRREAVDVAELAQATVVQMAPQAEARQVRLHVEAVADAPPAWVDPDRIVQVLVNLVDNAIKYSQAGGTVSLRLDAESERYVRVQVCDEGAGIPVEHLARVGERFYRADRARSRAEGGTGLGLAIAQALVEAHGGRLWVQSQEGQGTVVGFTLPRFSR